MGDEHEGHGHDDGHDGHGGEEHYDEDNWVTMTRTKKVTMTRTGTARRRRNALDYDPHSWLESNGLQRSIEVVLDAMKTTFPDGAASFQPTLTPTTRNSWPLTRTSSSALSETGSCDEKGRENVAANHNAYSYISVRYGMEFVTLHGLDPEGEPSSEDRRRGARTDRRQRPHGPSTSKNTLLASIQCA